MRLLTLVLILCVMSCKNETTQGKPSENLASAALDTEVLITDLQIVDYNGLQKFLSTKSDKILVVNFWATWCAPCIKELPYFEQLGTTYADNNVEVILVSLDFPKKYESQLKPYIVKNKIKSKVLALDDPDANSWIPKISEDWSGSIPATLIITKEKRQFYEQSFTYDELETEVKQFLK